MSDFTKDIKFRAAYDKRHPDPSKNYGIHCVDAIFVLHGEAGSLEWRLFTGWNLPHVARTLDTRDLGYPNGAELNLHSKAPRWEGHEPTATDCPYVGTCYSDVTFITDDICEALIARGDEGVWGELERRYHLYWPAEVSA